MQEKAPFVKRGLEEEGSPASVTLASVYGRTRSVNFSKRMSYSEDKTPA